MKLFAYVVGASKDPDYVWCKVPYEVNYNLIFFGPCTKLLWQKFYKRYLKNSNTGVAGVRDEVYLATCELVKARLEKARSV